MKTEITSPVISIFQHNVYAPFIYLLKEIISTQFSSSNIAGSFSIVDPRKEPADKTSYRDESIQTLVTEYESNVPAVSLDGTKRKNTLSTAVSTECKIYLPLLSEQNGDIKLQLTTNKMMIALLPNLYKLTAIYLTSSVSTASV